MRNRALRKAIILSGYENVADGLVKITGKSKSYMEKCLCGKKSFQPHEISLILSELNRPVEDVHILFPTLGIASKDKIDEEKIIFNYLKTHTFDELLGILKVAPKVHVRRGV
ncbi:MAG: hypothetical protein WCG21_10630 [Eubacteriales bacterium]